MRERTPFTRGLVSRLPNLTFLPTTGLRNNGLDLPALRDHGVLVVGTPSGGRSTTEHCCATILALARGLVPDDASVKAGGWQTGSAVPLGGRTLGVLGLGRLGAEVARVFAVAFNMKIAAWSPNLTQEKADEQARAAGLPEGTFRVVSREELFARSDVVSVHVVLSERSRGMVTKKDLDLMGPDSIFVNTSRGPIVVEKDLQEVLSEGKIRAAGIDVFEIEPLPLDSPWRTIKWGQEGRSQVLLTPHTGYAEKEKFASWYEQQAEAIIKWQKGEKLDNVLNA